MADRNYPLALSSRTGRRSADFLMSNPGVTVLIATSRGALSAQAALDALYG